MFFRAAIKEKYPTTSAIKEVAKSMGATFKILSPFSLAFFTLLEYSIP